MNVTVPMDHRIVKKRERKNRMYVDLATEWPIVLRLKSYLLCLKLWEQ